MDPDPTPPLPPEPSPMPEPNGPTVGFRDHHGRATLSLLLSITVVGLLAVGTGLSLFNTMEFARVKQGMRAESRQMEILANRLEQMEMRVAQIQKSVTVEEASEEVAASE